MRQSRINGDRVVGSTWTLSILPATIRKRYKGNKKSFVVVATSPFSPLLIIVVIARLLGELKGRKSIERSIDRSIDRTIDRSIRAQPIRRYDIAKIIGRARLVVSFAVSGSDEIVLFAVGRSSVFESTILRELHSLQPLHDLLINILLSFFFRISVSIASLVAVL